MDMAMELKMRRGWICRDMDQFYSMTPYFQKSRLQNDIKSDTSHPACISVMVSTNAEFYCHEVESKWNGDGRHRRVQNPQERKLGHLHQ